VAGLAGKELRVAIMRSTKLPSLVQGQGLIEVGIA
jgi:hypothetical protein